MQHRRPRKEQRPPARKLLHPSDLEETERKQLLGMLGIGVPQADACHAVGLHPARLREWLAMEEGEDAEVDAFRVEVLRADGQGVAQQVKVLWDGNDRVRCEQHRFLLARRRPAAFSQQAEHPAPTAPNVDVDEAEQVVAVLASVGVDVPPDVLAQLGLGGRA